MKYDVVRGADGCRYRPVERHPGRSAMGVSTDWVTCPWCGKETECYVWSLAGSGKKCACGALLGAVLAREPKR